MSTSVSWTQHNVPWSCRREPSDSAHLFSTGTLTLQYVQTHKHSRHSLMTPQPVGWGHSRVQGELLPARLCTAAPASAPPDVEPGHEFTNETHSRLLPRSQLVPPATKLLLLLLLLRCQGRSALGAIELLALRGGSYHGHACYRRQFRCDDNANYTDKRITAPNYTRGFILLVTYAMNTVTAHLQAPPFGHVSLQLLSAAAVGLQFPLPLLGGRRRRRRRMLGEGSNGCHHCGLVTVPG